MLVGRLFNGTSTQNGQFVPSAGERNRLSRLRVANEIQCVLFYVTRYVTRYTQLHERNNQLFNRMTYLLIITLAPSPIPSQIPRTLFDIISLGTDAVQKYV